MSSSRIKKIMTFIKGFAIFMVGYIVIASFWQIFFAALIALVIIALAYAFGGKLIGNVATGACLVILVSAQIHWISGNTICLTDPAHAYLWRMDVVGADNIKGSISEEDDGTLNISFSAKSDSMISGYDYAEIIVRGAAELYKFEMSQEKLLPNDISITQGAEIPEDLDGFSFFVPRNAEFRASLAFDSPKREFSVTDLPVLLKVQEDEYTPIGVLRGKVELGETAVIEPAAFDGRNLVLDGERRSTNSESNRQYFADKTADPGTVVEKLQRDWLTMGSPPHLYLHKYAEAYDCRPSAYQSIGIGWLFKSSW